MRQVVIENPVLNLPFSEPNRHFKFTEDGITDEIIDERRISSYFVPIAPPKKRKGKDQPTFFDTEWTQDRIRENTFINQVRDSVARWRNGISQRSWGDKGGHFKQRRTCSWRSPKCKL